MACRSVRVDQLGDTAPKKGWNDTASRLHVMTVLLTKDFAQHCLFAGDADDAKNRDSNECTGPGNDVGEQYSLCDAKDQK